MKKINVFIVFLISLCLLCACTGRQGGTESAAGTTNQPVKTDISTDTMDFEFTDSDTDYGYDEASAITVGENQQEVNITAAGTYVIVGSHTSVTVDAPDTAKIRIVLNDAVISNPEGPAINITEADKVFITAYKDTENTVSDSAEYSSDYDGTNIDGAIFSKADLTVNGEGVLNVNGEYKSGIVSKDDLVICGLTLNITSAGRAVEGKDCVKCLDASLNITAGGDGIKSTNTEDSARGYVYIASGSYSITAQNDGIQAETALRIDGGDFNVKTGGGSQNASTASYGWGMWGGGQSDESEESAKALKASSLVLINGGTFKIDSSDDAVHSNSDAEINGGSLEIASGDDGIHADDALMINGGNIVISKSYEGLEATAITISGGTADVTASDDGINAAGGNDSSALGGRPGENTFNSDSDAEINISGGYILINASGDGIDSNGSISISGGTLLVSGPESSGNGALDYQTQAVISGGTAILCGSAGMAQGFSSSSAQASFMYALDSTANAGSSVAVTDSSGTVIASFMPSKKYDSIVVSSPSLTVGASYTVTIDGTVSDCDANGFASSGAVTGGEESFSVELTSVSTSYGSYGGMGGAGGGGFGGRPGGMR